MVPRDKSFRTWGPMTRYSGRQVRSVGSALQLCPLPSERRQIRSQGTKAPVTSLEVTRPSLADTVSQSRKLLLTLICGRSWNVFQGIHGRTTDGTKHLSGTIHHGKQQHHPVVVVTTDAAPRERHQVLPLGMKRSVRFLRLTFPLRYRRRSDFSDFAQAFRFGRMRARDESSADLGRVPPDFTPRQSDLNTLVGFKVWTDEVA